MNANSNDNIYRSLLKTLSLPNISTGIGTETPNLNCIIDIASDRFAFRLPGMTTTQRDAIVSPVVGMLVYNLTTNVLNHHNGSVWGAV